MRGIITTLQNTGEIMSTCTKYRRDYIMSTLQNTVEIMYTCTKYRGDYVHFTIYRGDYVHLYKIQERLCTPVQKYRGGGGRAL